MSRWLQRVLVTGGLLVLVACKPNENSQRSQWEHNQKAAQTMAAHFPAAGKVLKARLDEVKVQWDKAAAEAEPEKRAEAMKAANDSLTDLTSGLASLENRFEHVERLKGDRRFKAMPAGVVMPAFRQADSAVARARSLVMYGSYATADDLKVATKDANKVMIAAVGALERLAKKK